MTKNQIEYAKLLELNRSNLANEGLTRERDTAAREARLVELGETSRHNQALEGIQVRSLDETSRHNLATERQTDTAQRETSRHNLATENEGRRHNIATEQLTKHQIGEVSRHNLATEQETNRSNVAREIELNRSNVAREKETARHNRVGEGLDAGRLTLDTVTREQQIAETKRHNLAMELKDYSTRVNLTQPVNVPVGGNTTDNSNRNYSKSSESNYSTSVPVGTSKGFGGRFSDLSTFGGDKSKGFGGTTDNRYYSGRNDFYVD